jgi:hypothetical protein
MVAELGWSTEEDGTCAENRPRMSMWLFKSQRVQESNCQ